MGQLVTKEMLFVKDEQSGEMILSPSTIEEVREMEVQMKKIKKEYDKYKKAMLEGMETYGLKKVETDDLLVTYVEPTERTSIDTDKLWSEHKDVAFACQKTSPVKSSIRITVR